MYCFSMEWFQQIFVECLSGVWVTESNVEPHLLTVIENLTATVLKRTSFSLSSEHYRPFVFRLCCSLCTHDGDNLNGKPKLSLEEWKTMVKVCSFATNKTDEVCDKKQESSSRIKKFKPDSIPQRVWDNVCFLENQLKSFIGLRDHIATHLDLWLKFLNDSNPFTLLQEMPSHNGFLPSVLTSFQQLLLVEVLCISRFSQEVDKFIARVLGDHFHQRPLVSLPVVLSTTKQWIPILLLVSGGKHNYSIQYIYAIMIT